VVVGGGLLAGLGGGLRGVSLADFGGPGLLFREALGAQRGGLGGDGCFDGQAVFGAAGLIDS